MSRPDTRSAQCDGKQPFAAYSAADKVAKRSGIANVYRCPHCNQFHIGHSSPRPPVGSSRRSFVGIDGFED